jgi:hypothetical protein
MPTERVLDRTLRKGLAREGEFVFYHTQLAVLNCNSLKRVCLDYPSTDQGSGDSQNTDPTWQYAVHSYKPIVCLILSRESYRMN